MVKRAIPTNNTVGSLLIYNEAEFQKVDFTKKSFLSYKYEKISKYDAWKEIKDVNLTDAASYPSWIADSRSKIIQNLSLRQFTYNFMLILNNTLFLGFIITKSSDLFKNESKSKSEKS
ncbi:hypothetical protein G6R29_00760 [Fructobacillus sp. M2-14]|uniref:Uncharacterized protein n=1 Tax=Fructobacillus broussonetiae TaxID=2713173 RepID=A0ABS5QYA9_9LACO|nr:hypothetical protein [Fructobacillus broussonetiae]MBS9338168.1 hypothetical protein [Fructobacillus broussonetiae]